MLKIMATAAIAAAILLSGCAAPLTKEQMKTAGFSDRDIQLIESRSIGSGMSKAAAEYAFCPPNRRSSSRYGEYWHYIIERRIACGHNVALIKFGANGKVENWIIGG